MQAPEGFPNQPKRPRTSSTDRDDVASSSSSLKKTTERPTPCEKDVAVASIRAMKAAAIISPTVPESKSIATVAAAQATRRGESFASASNCLSTFGAGGSKPQQLHDWIAKLEKLAVHEGHGEKQLTTAEQLLADERAAAQREEATQRETKFGDGLQRLDMFAVNAFITTSCTTAQDLSLLSTMLVAAAFRQQYNIVSRILNDAYYRRLPGELDVTRVQDGSIHNCCGVDTGRVSRDRTVLSLAAENGWDDLIDQIYRLAQRQSSEAAQALLDQVDGDGLTPLQHALREAKFYHTDREPMRCPALLLRLGPKDMTGLDVPPRVGYKPGLRHPTRMDDPRYNPGPDAVLQRLRLLGFSDNWTSRAEHYAEASSSTRRRNSV